MVSSAITGAAGVSAADTRTAASSKTKDSGADFTAVLAKSVTSNLSDTNKNTSAKMSTDVNTKTDTTAKTSANTATKTDTADKSTSTAKTADKTVSTKTSAKDSAKQTVNDKSDDAGKAVFDEIKENFDVTDEQLVSAMETLGLTMADLLTPANITQLVVQVTGSQNAMDIVTDGNMLDSLKAVLSVLDTQLNNLAADADIPVETVKEILSNPDDAVVTAASQDTVIKTDKAVTQEAVPAEENEAVQTDKSDTSMSDVIASKLTVNTEDDKSQTGSRQSDGKGIADSRTNTGETNVAATQGNVVNDITETFETAFENTDSRVDAANIVDQVVESIKLNATTELKSMEIQLNPQNLGKVNLMVSVREGVVTAQITAENEQVRKALESQVSILKENIESQGIKVDAVEVSVQTSAFDANQQQFADQRQAEQNGRAARRVRLGGFSFDDDDDDDDDITATALNENSSVEFTA